MTPSEISNAPVDVAGNLPSLYEEAKSSRIIWAFFAILIVIGFFAATHSYWVPSTPGPDQNGYLVGGKNFARSWTTGFKPVSPYAFVGREWIEARGKYFPKYPLGLSVIYALALKAGGVKSGVPAAFMVNPVAMALALVAIFLLARVMLESFFALLAMLLIATSPVCIGLTNTPSSHATALCLVSWGAHLLFRWWQSNGTYRALGAGLLIGSAVTIRYTEGMLILPLVIVACFNLRKEPGRPWRRKSVLQCAVLLGGWAFPVSLLVAYNWFSMHHLTGYDTTNESTGFTLEKFQENWEIMLRELYNTGLFFTLPFALLGAMLMFRWNWRVSLVLAAWAVPNLVLYTSYYWAPDGPNIGYLRFVLTIFPALAIAALFAFKWIILQGSHSKLPNLFAVAVLVAIGCGVNLNTALAASETEFATDHNLLDSARQILKVVPKESMVFTVEQQLNYLQLVGDYELCDLQQFDAKQVEQYASIDPEAVTSGLQPQRAMEIYDRVKGLPEVLMARELVRQQNQLMTDAIHRNQRVFFVMPNNRRGEINRLTPKNLFTQTVIASWDEPTDTRLAKKPHWIGITRTNPLAVPKPVPGWQVVEVTLAPPPLPPKAKPVRSKAPATKPSVK